MAEQIVRFIQFSFDSYPIEDQSAMQPGQIKVHAMGSAKWQMTDIQRFARDDAAIARVNT